MSGQAAMDVVVNPPRPGEPSYELWKKVRWLLRFNFERYWLVRKVI